MRKRVAHSAGRTFRARARTGQGQDPKTPKDPKTNNSNASAIAGPYKVGDIVSYTRRPRVGETGKQWSVGSRIIGFEVDPMNADKDPTHAWVVCDGLPILVAADKLRPCTAAELLDYQYMNDQVRQPVVDTDEQQSFIDERSERPERTKKARKEGRRAEPEEQLERSATAASSSGLRPHSSMDEDSEVTDAEVKETPAKELRVEPVRKIHTKQLEGTPLSQNWKRTKTTGKGVGMVENIAYLLDENQDNP